MSIEGKTLTVNRQKDRRAVESGNAYYLRQRPKYVVEVAQPETRPVKHERRSFGHGLGERNPVHRLPVSVSDYEWWTTEANREQERDLERRFQEFVAMDRLSAGLDPY